MPEIKKVTSVSSGGQTIKDLYETPRETWQYITIPDEDPLGKAFPSIYLNKEKFEAGQVYNVPAQIASFVNERIKIFNRSCVRLLQPDMAQDGIVRTADGASAPMPTLTS
jgi:hypothetical protein